MSGRNDIKEDNDSGIKSPEQDTVLILTSEGEKEFDDKASRPCSGEVLNSWVMLLRWSLCFMRKRMLKLSFNVHLL